jgi:hypothetical protein
VARTTHPENTMKHLIVGLALAGLSFACQSEPKTAVGEGDAAPKAECSTEHCEGMKGECTGEMKKECEGKTCPVTGATEKPIS